MRLKPQKKSYVVMAPFFSFLVTIGGCLLLGFLFKVEKKSGERTNNYQPLCILLQQDPVRLQPWSYGNTILDWADIHDPTIMTLYNEKHGFSLSEKDDLELPYHEVGTVDLPTPRLKMSEIEAKPYDPPLPTLGQSIKNSWKTSLMSASPIDSIFLPQKTFWFAPDGTELKKRPPFSLETAKELVLEDYPRGRTVMEVLVFDSFFTVHVTQSCNNAELDVIAQQAVNRYLFDLQESSSADLRTAISKRLFGDKEFEALILSIDWRLLAAGENLKNIKLDNEL